ncbi:hypothetical protein [Pseudomonas savastanoi]|nr:hypothetical protein [Pseudomonas savastanoi]
MHDTFFVEEDINLVEKQADMWLASFEAKEKNKIKPIRAKI